MQLFLCSTSVTSSKENLTCHYLRKWALLSTSTPAPTSPSPSWMAMTSTHSSCPAHCFSRMRPVASAPALCTWSTSQRAKRWVAQPSLSHTTSRMLIWVLGHYGCNKVQCFKCLTQRVPNVCHAAGHCAGLLSWSHSCSGWRQRTQLFTQLCHSFRYNAHRCEV